jgi:RNA polymerase sigma-32 factor
MWNEGHMENRRRKDSAKGFVSKEDEERAFKAFYEEKSFAARNSIILNYSCLVRCWAAKYGCFYGVDAEELISEGTLGLMKAMELFDPNKGFRFATYASFWIKAFLRQYIFLSKSIVRRSRQCVRSMNREGNEAAGWKAFNTSFQADVSVDKNLDGDDGQSGNLLDVMPDERANFEEKAFADDLLRKRRLILKKVIGKLKEKEIEVIKRRHLRTPPETLENIAKDFSITIEGVRQIEKRAITKMQSEVKKTMTMKAIRGNL